MTAHPDADAGALLSAAVPDSSAAAQRAAMRRSSFNSHAQSVVAEFKRQHNLPMLSPKLCRDLAERITDAMTWARNTKR